MTVQDEAEHKRILVEPLFQDLEARIDRVIQVAELGFVEEALILGLCHLSGMAQLRFAAMRDDLKVFSDFVQKYGGHPEVFDRVSRVAITRWTENDPVAPKGLHEHAAVSAEVSRRFGDEPTVVGDPTKAELLAALDGVPRIDVKNLRANLWRYSYAAILYRNWRNPGVHTGEIDAPWEMEAKQKAFPTGDNGELAYYGPFGRLTFSAKLVIDTLRSAFEALKAECVERGVLPHELLQSEPSDV